ncbi:MAG: hypothetical protein KBS35_00385 [Mycoplasma sp.]|nr:hypothetical protein [Candidatus Hennigella equi]
MNYPMQQLVIIGPALFIVLMIAFPLIGVFGGWKRAVYWGGGNFLFYVIGLLVWRFTSGGIVNLIKPLLEKLTTEADFSKIAVTIAAPIFFVLIFIVANLLLLINYYAWFKRVAKLKKYQKVKKTDKQGNVTKVKVQVQKNTSTKYKVINHVVGGVSMTALMLPSTFAFTQATMYATTSVTTRKNNAFASNVYNMLAKVNDKMSWLSYYTADSAKDYDALFAGLAMREKKIVVKLPGQEEEQEVEVIDAVSQTFEQGIGQIYDSATKGEGAEKTLDESITELKDSWNAIVEGAGDEMSALFNSDNATEVMQGLLEIPDDSGATLGKDEVEAFIDPEGKFQEKINEYKQQFDQVTIGEAAYNNILNEISGMYDFKEEEVTPEQQAEFNKALQQVMNLLFNKA